MYADVIQSQALNFARRNRKRIARELTDPNKYKPEDIPVSVFMAGSPGAGKTEFSKNLIALLEENKDHQVIRIDGDEIRPLLPGYTGSNSYLFQGAVSLIVEKIHDFALGQKGALSAFFICIKVQKSPGALRKKESKLKAEISRNHHLLISFLAPEIRS